MTHFTMRLVVVAFLLGAFIGCHSMRFQVADVPNPQVIQERKWFFLWGLVPTRTVDVEKKCPNGVAAVAEQTTFTDGLFEFFTLGICGARSSTYYCRPAAQGGGS